ncbi:MAG: saccharopine dehydrogenase NADP-binding domain-containing protein [Salegentibacter sp.]|uniref:saccharopine dehydrogenase family protein n=1 Tax=Salegentibacter sp. TaxID=1903072 RepID=UPI0028707B99|nr:saccharopine dehydrogenase NADP-binding domain-containing protein [Salegentibacter sp.]MDR9458509.1 saccharopine dehydrogenase NADP-binding domain-containing protein [Salegentibacter sp.]
MKKHYNIIIAGAGGIAEAAALLLAEWSGVTPSIYIGNRTLSNAQELVKWVREGTTKNCEIEAFHLPGDKVTEEMKAILQKADIILDCLPGSLAPRIAKLAKDHKLHYVNLTEYVAETDQIIDLARDAHSGFVLQSGLAPGYINILAMGLFNDFREDFDVKKVDKLEFKVGALTKNAVSPHYYGFTWSPVGVATEYLNKALVLRDYKKASLPPLSERKQIIIDGLAYEEDLTSGGAADLPDALAEKVSSLDYKTLRHPGHYAWVEEQLEKTGKGPEAVKELQEIMQTVIPNIEDDQIIIYAAVEGKDSSGTLQRREVSKHILPLLVGRHKLRAIQTTTAAGLLQCAQIILESNKKGVVLQSMIEPEEFLNGNFILPVYGKT